jgi:hypothetical protein
MADRVSFCVMSPTCPGPSILVDTCYGFTGGDAWACQTCGSYCVTRSQEMPQRPRKREVSNG